MKEIHAKQVVFDDNRTLDEVIASIIDMIEAKGTEETVEEGEVNE